MLCSTVLGESPMMTYPELQATLAEAANIINDSPVCSRDLEHFTVNMLFLGRCSNQAIAYNKEGALVGLDGMINKRRQLLEHWWTLWREQSFSYLFPFKRKLDSKTSENVQIGGICMVKYITKINHYYRLCIATRAEKSLDGVVRTVTISMRNQRVGVNKDAPNIELEVAVQRLAIVQRKAEYEVQTPAPPTICLSPGRGVRGQGIPGGTAGGEENVL